MSKKQVNNWVFGLILTVVFLSGNIAKANDYCPDPENPHECPDYYGDIWCCPKDSPVCCSDLSAYGYDVWCCPEGTKCSENYFECIEDTSTVPTSTTTTVDLLTTTTTVVAGTTTTIPNSETTTTVSISGSDIEFITGINIKGSDAAQSESSGTLPGTSPSVVDTLLYGKDGRPIPLWYDKHFPPLDPELLKKTRELLEEKKKPFRTREIEPYQTGEQKSFWVKDDNDRVWRQVSATNMKTGTYSYIFVDDTLSIPDFDLELYAGEFDIMYGDVLSPNIGDFVDRDGNGKITILLYNMNDGGSINMYMGGYFWMKDYIEDSLTKKQGIRSNEMDIVYIRGNEPTGWEQVGGDFYEYNLTTLVHECQHLIHFGVMVWNQGDSGISSDVWIDEMMAMSTETMYFKEKLKQDFAFSHPGMQDNGYLASRIEYYNADSQGSIRNGHGLTYWDNNGDVLANYSLSYLMGQYLSIHSTSGQGVFKDILNYMISNGVHDYQGVAGAASQSIPGIGSWEDLLKSYAIANMANQAAGLFGYNGEFSLVANGPTINRVSIHNGGAVYRNVGGEWTPPSGTGQNIKFFDSNGTLIPTTVATGCMASGILGENSAGADLLRNFRDEVLSGSDAGKELMELYYKHTAELTSIMLNDPDIKAEAGRLLLKLLPLINKGLS